MRILLLGDYSNVHATLAEGLKALGHECVVASDGDHWKDYPRDIDLHRKMTLWGTLCFLLRLLRWFPTFRGYDIVQLVNPIFLELKAQRLLPFYQFLRRHNRKVILGAFGIDHYWVQVNREVRPLRYSDFNIGDHVRTDAPAQMFVDEWMGTAKERLNRTIAQDADWIVTVLYEYWATYQAVPELRDKISFIPEPMRVPLLNKAESRKADSIPQKVKFFIGISRDRSAYKGTDILLKAAEAVREKYPERMELVVAEGVPFATYQQMMDDSDVILDQIYSYTPSMNSLLAMAKGLVVVGGGEPENYEILHETEIRPIINVLPQYDSCHHAIEQLVLHPERIPELKRQSVEYVRRHHDYLKVARAYEALYQKLLDA